MYSHFYIEHVRGHHRMIGTPKDPATAYLGEPWYKFIVRSVFGQIKNFWSCENEKLKRKGVTGLAAFLSNKLVIFHIGHLAYLSFIYYVFGLRGLAFVLFLFVYAVTLLETINYIEHYGLVRKKDENGVYEPVMHKHSWNAPQMYSNYMLFRLQRHSDHHSNAYKPYQTLSSFEDTPALIGGYSIALLIAPCSKVWFKAYDPLVKAVREGKELTPELKQASTRVVYTYYLTLATIISCLFIYSLI